MIGVKGGRHKLMRSSIKRRESLVVVGVVEFT